MIEDIDYDFIKQWLAYGQIKELAAKHSISRSAAYNILKGKAKNFDFVLEAYTIAIERAAKFKNANDRLKEITTNE